MKRITSTCIGVALALTLGMATKAEAQCSVALSGPFCIDGTITDANNSGLAGATIVTAPVEPAGSTKELGPVNGNSTKLGNINIAPAPMLGLTNPNAQVDLNKIYTQTAVDPNTGHVWYYFAWVRDANSGSGFISIELQKSGVPAGCVGGSGYANASCNPWSGRQTNDFIILWDQQGNATQISIRKYNLSALAFGPKIDLDDTTSKAQYSGDFFKGEAAIDFTANVFGGSGSSTVVCQSFANTIPGTVTGNSDTADYKDAVLAAFPPVSNCGTVTITKATIPAGQAGSFGYTLSRLPTGDIFDGTVDTDCASASDKTQCQGTLTAGQTVTITDLLQTPANTGLTLSEPTMPAGFVLDSISCTLGENTYDVDGGDVFPVVATKTTACTITNKLNTGTLRVVKVVNNGFGLTANRSDFSYRIDGASAGSIQTLIAFVDNATGATYTLTDGTTYTVVEPSVPSGWQNPQYSRTGCTGTIAAGEEKVCTVTNNAQQQQPTIATVQKAVLHDQAGVAGVRRGATETTINVSFFLYSTLTACNNDTNKNGTGALGSNPNRPVVFANGTDTSGAANTNTGVEVTLSQTYWWRAVSSGNNFNAGFSSDCSETATITFAGS